MFEKDIAGHRNVSPKGESQVLGGDKMRGMGDARRR